MKSKASHFHLVLRGSFLTRTNGGKKRKRKKLVFRFFFIILFYISSVFEYKSKTSYSYVFTKTVEIFLEKNWNPNNPSLYPLRFILMCSFKASLLTVISETWVASSDLNPSERTVRICVRRLLLQPPTNTLKEIKIGA